LFGLAFGFRTREGFLLGACFGGGFLHLRRARGFLRCRERARSLRRFRLYRSTPPAFRRELALGRLSHPGSLGCARICLGAGLCSIGGAALGALACFDLCPSFSFSSRSCSGGFLGLALGIQPGEGFLLRALLGGRAFGFCSAGRFLGIGACARDLRRLGFRSSAPLGFAGELALDGFAALGGLLEHRVGSGARLCDFRRFALGLDAARKLFASALFGCDPFGGCGLGLPIGFGARFRYACRFGFGLCAQLDLRLLLLLHGFACLRSLQGLRFRFGTRVRGGFRRAFRFYAAARFLFEEGLRVLPGAGCLERLLLGQRAPFGGDSRVALGARTCFRFVVSRLQCLRACFGLLSCLQLGGFARAGSRGCLHFGLFSCADLVPRSCVRFGALQCCLLGRGFCLSAFLRGNG
jgi:hypothetical protein